MNGDALELMQRLGEIHADLKDDIGKLKSNFKEDIGQLKADFAGFEGSAGARISAIEVDMKDQKFWGNVKAASGPVMVMLHIAAHKLGLKSL